MYPFLTFLEVGVWPHPKLLTPVVGSHGTSGALILHLLRLLLLLTFLLLRLLGLLGLLLGLGGLAAMGELIGGFHKWWYSHSWMVYKGKSQSKMDDLRREERKPGEQRRRHEKEEGGSERQRGEAKHEFLKIMLSTHLWNSRILLWRRSCGNVDSYFSTLPRLARSKHVAIMVPHRSQHLNFGELSLDSKLSFKPDKN